ncbi:MAG: TAXI family TRAP transporter solute-binding subunit, partial [Micromonosporaceae bacterium]
ALVLLLLAGATLTGASASPPGPAYPGGPLPIATGERDGVYYQYGLALRDAIKQTMPALDPYLTVSSSSRRNLELAADGTVQLAFAGADAVASLPSHDTGRLATLARLYDNYLHLVVRRGETPAVRSMTDLRGKRISIGPEGTGTARTAIQLLRVAELEDAVTIQRLGFHDSATALREGTIDAFFFFGGLPTLPIETLNLVQPIQLIDLGEWIDGLSGHGDFYTQLTIPASTYGPGIDAVTTVGLPNYLVVPKRMDPDLAYALTDLLFAQREQMAIAHAVVSRLDRRAAIATPRPMRLHPGALAYYRETQV